MDCVIVEKQDIWSPVKDTIGLMSDAENNRVQIQTEYRKNKVKYESDTAIDAILQIPIEEIFASDYGLQIKKTGDKYNFIRA